MATNPPPGDNHRKGAVRDRTQVYNPKTDNWTKRNKVDGRFMDQKADRKPFKGVRKENNARPDVRYRAALVHRTNPRGP